MAISHSTTNKTNSIHHPFMYIDLQPIKKFKTLTLFKLSTLSEKNMAKGGLGLLAQAQSHQSIKQILITLQLAAITWHKPQNGKKQKLEHLLTFGGYRHNRCIFRSFNSNKLNNFGIFGMQNQVDALISCRNYIIAH